VLLEPVFEDGLSGLKSFEVMEALVLPSVVLKSAGGGGGRGEILASGWSVH